MNQLVLTTVLIALLGAAYYLYNSGDQTKEGFWMIPNRQVKVEKMFKDPTTQDFFQVPNFQGILSPRFSNVNYGPDLRTKFPNYNRMGVPQDPLQENANPPDPLNYAIAEGIPKAQASLVEAFQGHGWQESKHLGAPKIPLDPHNPYSAAYANGDYNQVINMAVGAGADGWPTSTVAQLDQASFMTQDGEMKQPIVYDRYMYANRNSRLRGQGDPIRGDLPIVPISGNWFIPSAAAGNNVNQVLQQGAMNVLGGVNNETSNSLANLIYNSSGGTDTTIGGVDMAQTNMSHQVYGAASAAMGDVQTTSFP
jgi:hypothetical protein